MLGLFAIGAITPVAAGMVVFSACLISLGKAFSAFAGGIIKLSIAAAILTVLSAFAGPLREVIVNAADDIEAALTAILTAICNTINNCAEPIGAALLTLCKVLIQTVIDLIGWAWDGNGEGGGIKAALDDLWEQLKAWIGEKGSEVSKLVNPLDPTSWVDTFTAKDRAFGAILNGITDPFLAPFGTSLDDLGNQLENKMQGVGENLSQGFANGIEANANVSDDASADMGQQAVDAAAEAAGVASPSWKTFEIGGYMAQGLANGLAAPESLGAVTSSASALSNAVETNFRNFWGIHSPSTRMADMSEYIPEGFKEGVTGTDGTVAIGDGISGMLDSAGIWLDKLFPGLLNKAKNYGSQFQNALLSGSEYQGMPGFDEWYEKEISAYRVKQPGGKTGLTSEDLDADIKKDPKDTKNPTVRGGKTKKSTGKKKTVAEQIEEKYKAKLQANKTLREIADNEYELWLTENQYSADADTLLAKKAENAAAEIKNQTDRVAIAQQKYDEMAKRWGKDKQETKDAYNDLLEEKTNLSKLKADQYTNLFEEVTKRYDTDLDTLEKQYNLWTAQNDGTATKLDKIERETQYQKDELAIKQKKLDNAQQQYDTLKAKYGESDLRTIEAYNDLLDARKDALEIQNDLAHKELDRIDIMIENLQTAQSRMQSRMDILSTVYDDGSLKERENAYKQAVEEYGKDSEQARKAQFQGTTSAILGTVTALKNLNYQMQQTIDYQKKFDEVKNQNYAPDSDEYKNAESDWLSSKSSFIGFASNLADALNMEDTGKRAMLIFANSFQEHYDVFENTFNKVLEKVKGSMSDAMQKTFSDIFGVMKRDEFTQLSTEFISTISSALQGDWAGALASAFAFAMDFAFTDTGKDIQGWFKDTVFPAMKKGLDGIANAMTGDGGLVSIFQNGGQQIVAAFTGGGGITEAIAAIGPMLANAGAAISAFVAEFWWVFLILGAIAALIGGIAWYVSSRKKKSNSTTIGEEFDKEFSSGIEDNADKVNDAVTDMTENAVDIAKNALSTINKVMDDDYEYTPQITPVVDLSNVVDAATEANTAFEATAKAMSLDDDVTQRMAAQIEAQAEIQNGIKAAANNDTLNAINALGEHMDGVADSIRGMKMTIDGKKTIGYIDAKLGQRTAAKVR